MNNELMEAPIAGLLTELDIQLFEEVDTVLQRSLAIGDPLIALEYASGLQKESLLRGLAIAKMMYKLKESWELFTVAGVEDTFENVIEAHSPYKASTLDKYIRMWKNIFESRSLSAELKNQLSGRPIGDLLLLSAAARDGSLTEDDWMKVTIAEDTNKVREIVRKARGEVTSSSSALIPKLQVREGAVVRGTMYFYNRDGIRKDFGTLMIDDPDPDVQQMIARVINRLNVGEV
jgi:hypothetical protein